MALEKATVAWESGPIEGRVEVAHGTLASARVVEGAGSVDGPAFRFPAVGPCRLHLEFGEARVTAGGRATRVTLRTERNPFTFFLRDATAENPIFLPQHGAAVTTAEDPRSYASLAAAVRDRALASSLARIEGEPEESYEGAAGRVRSLTCRTWLGLGRDIRIFEIAPRREGGYWGWIKPRFHRKDVTVPDGDAERPLSYDFALGRGAGCEVNLSRRLEEGCLPILRGEGRDGSIRYEITAFVTLERTPLKPGAVRGTHFLVADGHSAGHAFTPEQEARFKELLPAEMNRDEETVLHLRAEAVNIAEAPSYAWFRAPALERRIFPERGYDGESGLCLLGTDQAYCVARLDGRPMPEEECAVLVPPGGRVACEFAVPHRPLSRERAAALSRADFDERLDECRAFWMDKLEPGAHVALPEKRVDEMVRAGRLHLDLVAYGLEPDGPLAAVVGVYSPIGSESAPIVLFHDCMGRHDLARRAIDFFLEKQHEDGFIQNFNGYTLETGGVLFMIGEHYRFTRDLEWLRGVKAKALKSCRYIIDWRGRNLRADLRGRGYGMLDGKVADPNDPTRYFMNSGFACLGLKRAAEWLAEFDPKEAEVLAAEAEAFRGDIRTALVECIARSPVVPLGDGTWCPTAPPWAEATGAQALYCEGESCFTHESVSCRDSLLGPLWLVFQEVLEPREEMSRILLESNAELATQRNVPFSQPYYCRSDYVHLRRGEVKAFLKRYYSGFAALADRETYTWWEHFHHVSPHKVTEEAWFLMETRWMLLLEEDRDLHLLRAIPRAWLAPGRRIAFENMATYFGPVSLEVESRAGGEEIRARYACAAGRGPARLLLRLPHPEGLRPKKIAGGDYCARTETVEIERPGEGSVSLAF